MDEWYCFTALIFVSMLRFRFSVLFRQKAERSMYNFRDYKKVTKRLQNN